MTVLQNGQVSKLEYFEYTECDLLSRGRKVTLYALELTRNIVGKLTQIIT